MDSERALEIAGGVQLIDIAEQLPKHPTKKQKLRKKRAKWLFVHHNGVSALDDKRNHIAWIESMARFHVGKGWANIAYRFAIPYHGMDDGIIRVYRCLPWNAIGNHVRSLGGRCNRFGDSLVLQGNLNIHGLSSHQEEALEAFFPWYTGDFMAMHKTDISWHSDAARFGGIPKKACPGSNAKKWLNNYLSK